MEGLPVWPSQNPGDASWIYDRQPHRPTFEHDKKAVFRPGPREDDDSMDEYDPLTYESDGYDPYTDGRREFKIVKGPFVRLEELSELPDDDDPEDKDYKLPQKRWPPGWRERRDAPRSKLDRKNYILNHRDQWVPKEEVWKKQVFIMGKEMLGNFDL